MKTKSAGASRLTAVALLFLITAIPGISLKAQVQTLYDAPGTPAWRDNYTGGSGCQFTVGPTNVVVSHLGYFQSNAVSYASIVANGGLHTNHLVGIYSYSIPPQLLAQVTVPSGSSADYYTNQFAWMPLNPPVLLASNTTYYVAALPYNGDGDLWGDTFTADYNGYFVGGNASSCVTVYGPGGTTWPIGGFSLQGMAGPSTYCVEGMANIAIDPARVNVQSTNVIASLGATLNVVGFASGAQPITYQWWAAPNTPMPGQTNAILTIANAALANSGTYFLTASNALGGAQSANVTVFVGGPIAIQQSPTNTTVFALYPATFSCLATGGAPVFMQWSTNGVSDATSATNLNAYPASSSYTFFASQANNGEVYSCLASNYVQGTPYTVTSSNATLTVVPNFAYPQEILHGPPSGVSRTSAGVAGGHIYMNSLPVLVTHLGFDASALTTSALSQDHHVGIWNGTGSQLLGYVVVTNGTPTNTAISGYLWAALNPPLLLAANSNYIVGAETFATGDAWNDTAAVTDWNKVITTGNNAATYLNSGGWPNAPVSGNYGGQMYGCPNMASLVISNEIFSLISPSGVAQSAGSSVTLNGYVGGPPPVTAQWYLNGVPVPGQTNVNLTIPSLAQTNAGSYTLVARNAQSSLSATSQVATVIIYGGAVVLSQMPMTYTNVLNTNYMSLYPGASPTFSVNALGSPPLSYQWFTNGVPVGGATNLNYNFVNATAAGPSIFYCVVSNTYLSTAFTATSMVWAASIVPAATNSAGGPALYPQAVLALNPIGYWRLNEPDCCGGSGPNDGAIAYDYAGGNNGIYTNAVLGQSGYNSTEDPSDSSPLFGSTTFTDSDANSIGGVNFGSPAGTSKAFTVEAWVNGYPQTLDAGIVTLGWGGGGEQFNLDCGADGGTPNHAFRFFIRDAAGNVHSVGSTIAPTLGTWYHLVGVVDEITNQTVTLYINGQSVGTASAPSGSGVLANISGVIASTNLMSIGARSSSGVGSLNLQFVGSINDVAAFNYALSPSQVLNQYLLGASTAPYLNPAPSTVVFASQGQPLSIPAMAFGPPVLGYQWVNLSTSQVLASGTGSAIATSLNVGFSTNSTPASWNGQTLELQVTNAYGSTNFDVALTVAVSPVISMDLPSPITVGQGQTYTYNLGVVGVPPLAYQWYEGSSAIVGATNATYAPATGSGSTNTFFAVVTNSYGSITSAISTFAVIPLPNTPLASAITVLKPVAYWPMHEVEPAAPGDIEVNNGTLGVLGNAYYPDWAGDNATAAFVRQQSGPIADGSSQSVLFTAGNSATTNAVYIPHTSPATTLVPPFTVECWFYPTGSQNDIWSQDGYEGLNAGSIGGGGGSVCGIRLYGGGSGTGNAGGGLTVYTYNNSSGLNGPLSTGTVAINQWYHVVVTCDAHTNISIYTNSVQLGATTSYTGLYAPDYWTPFELGNGRGDTRACKCQLSEVAIYTNALTTAKIANHYQTGINPAPATSYFNTVSNDLPVVYLRMNAPTYTPPDVSTWPALYNYGSVLGNGVYTPGTMPGIMPGPAATYTTVNQGTNVALFSGVSSFADAGYSPVWDPSAVNGGSNSAFSVVCSFRGNPADNRYQCLVGHSDSSWRMALGANAAGGGAQGSVQFSYGSSAASTVSCNDGKWHQAVGVYQPGTTASPGTVRLYVDGQLNTVNTSVNSNGIAAGAPQYDVLLGAAPDYTNQDVQNVGSPYSLGRQFAGELSDVALFTNALTAAQVQALYLAAGGAQQTLSINNYLPQTLRVSSRTNLMTVYAGASPNFMVSVSGAPVFYQWFTNNVAVGSGTNAILTLPGVQNAFTTYCIATNNNNSVTSVVWSASVMADPDPAGSFSQTIMSDSPVAYWRLNETAGSTVAVDYAGGANGLYGSQTTNGLPGVPIVTAAPEYAVAMDPGAANGNNATVTNAGIILNTNACTFVVWVYPTTAQGSYVGTFDNRSTANFSGVGLSSQPTWGADWNNAGQTYGFNSGLSVPPLYNWFMGVVEIFPQYSVFATFTNTGAGYVVSAYVTNSTVPCPIESFYGYNEIGGDPGQSLSRVWHGEINELAIFNYELSPAQLNALFMSATNGATVPFFATQPQNATIAVGSARNFTVGASSFVQPLTYQWYYNTSSSYAGAATLANGVQANGSWVTNVTTAQLTVTNGTFGAAGYYFVSVGNTAGTSDSAIAQLTVTPVTTPTNIVVSLTGTNFTLHWPSNWTGWRLQVQTNSSSVGLGTNWVTVAGSTGTNQVVIPVNTANGNVFYRLVYP